MVYVGGFQNYGPFLDPYYNTTPKVSGTQKGTIILMTMWNIRKHLLAEEPRQLFGHLVLDHAVKVCASLCQNFQPPRS